MLDSGDHCHVLTLNEAIQKSIISLQQNNIIDADLQVLSEPSQTTSTSSRSLNNDSSSSMIRKGISSLVLPSTSTRNNSNHEDRENEVIRRSIRFAMELKTLRHSSLTEFYSQFKSSSSSSSSSSLPPSCPIDSVNIMQSTTCSTNSSTNKSISKCSIPVLTPLQFKQKYLYSNIPCLIHNLNEEEFKPVSSNWVKQVYAPTPITTKLGAEIKQEENKKCINTEWFLCEIGPSTLVPVRQKQSSSSQQQSHLKYTSPDDDYDEGEELDEDGRAIECKTIDMSMKEWIQFVSKQQGDVQQQQKYPNKKENDIEVDDYDDDNDDIHIIDNNDNRIMKGDPNLYLKDWHLQNILDHKWCVHTKKQQYERHMDDNLDSNITVQQHQLHQQLKNTNPNHSFTPSADPVPTITPTKKEILYTIPQIFDGDVFNPFLLSNSGGDYRFVYWGPKGSSTSIHSDVLHTFSWSFNVVGEKKWIFYPPSQNDTANNDENDLGSKKGNTTTDTTSTTPKSFEIIQKTGETIYVPSGWKHSVCNLLEFLFL